MVSCTVLQNIYWHSLFEKQIGNSCLRFKYVYLFIHHAILGEYSHIGLTKYRCVYFNISKRLATIQMPINRGLVYYVLCTYNGILCSF